MKTIVATLVALAGLASSAFGVGVADDLAHRTIPASRYQFSLYIRADWPATAILDGSWKPPGGGRD